jgi:hypothetical protein
MGERKRQKAKRSGDLSIVDDGDGYAVLQCRCGCSPESLAKGMYEKHGLIAVDATVIMRDGAPALRARFARVLKA